MITNGEKYFRAETEEKLDKRVGYLKISCNQTHSHFSPSLLLSFSFLPDDSVKFHEDILLREQVSKRVCFIVAEDCRTEISCIIELLWSLFEGIHLERLTGYSIPG